MLTLVCSHGECKHCHVLQTLSRPVNPSANFSALSACSFAEGITSCSSRGSSKRPPFLLGRETPRLRTLLGCEAGRLWILLNRDKEGWAMEEGARNLREQGIIHNDGGSVIAGGGGRAEAARRISTGDTLEHHPVASSCCCVIS
jgi:hypothetical protein